MKYNLAEQLCKNYEFQGVRLHYLYMNGSKLYAKFEDGEQIHLSKDFLFNNDIDSAACILMDLKSKKTNESLIKELMGIEK